MDFHPFFMAETSNTREECHHWFYKLLILNKC
ncbi:hypothetical protein Vch1786_I1421 [Vibrio cholerae O1 str. 2010EL-1786]|uniref:Uncharacterized protein n=2 Tax=Vibrio cholerae TaxID=666 RepID=Q9KQR8_VIBCH|nr:hypothetical protein VC_1930 [Vibrio cholerae O1 biovar El Tor str. N16961]ACP06160.1 conserved hypothetical protein [Vibrio cholerae M66-2]ACP10038.1 conserved hypothetical protein [Vibrio cholerae O395]ACQ60599.1 hypothetical protein VCD_002433 [Vibrio cholerae MJ-1236]AET27022.1 hypothetical protein Vch1786_I1421 [Vibrio cholerae O1 str. 2010EL-1786]EEO08589.1 hypothetical protein VCC_002952 [Vibrio cholerae RC9]EEO16694.1 hypothetical protein VCE_003197 [Vibrio cholerae B33]